MAAEHYVHGHHESVLRSHKWRTVENSAAYLIPQLTAGRALLDIGSGPGTITVDFAKRLSPGRVTGIDAAAGVVDQARQLAGREHIDNVEFRSGDAYSLPFDDDSFDIAHAHQVLQHLADPVAALKEMKRVVRPGGVVAVRDVDYGGAIWYPASPGLELWLDVYQQVHRAAGGEPDAGRRLGSWARKAGLRDIVITGSLWAFASEEERRWWGGLWADRALHSSFATDALASGIATQGDLGTIADAWTEWAGAPDGWFSFPHGEVIATVA